MKRKTYNSHSGWEHDVLFIKHRQVIRHLECHHTKNDPKFKEVFPSQLVEVYIKGLTALKALQLMDLVISKILPVTTQTEHTHINIYFLPLDKQWSAHLAAKHNLHQSHFSPGGKYHGNQISDWSSVLTWQMGMEVSRCYMCSSDKEGENMSKKVTKTDTYTRIGAYLGYKKWMSGSTLGASAQNETAIIWNDFLRNCITDIKKKRKEKEIADNLGVCQEKWYHFHRLNTLQLTGTEGQFSGVLFLQKTKILNETAWTLTCSDSQFIEKNFKALSFWVGYFVVNFSQVGSIECGGHILWCCFTSAWEIHFLHFDQYEYF